LKLHAVEETRQTSDPATQLNNRNSHNGHAMKSTVDKGGVESCRTSEGQEGKRTARSRGVGGWMNVGTRRARKKGGLARERKGKLGKTPPNKRPGFEAIFKRKRERAHEGSGEERG